MISLVLAFHNHQPVGNFGWVIEDAYAKSYLPLMQVLGEYPEIRFAQHYTGILFDWFSEHHPDFIDLIRDGVRSGRIELVSGGYYEPILAMLPERDRQAQLLKLNRRIERDFGAHPTGMWLAERVWEPSLPRTLADAGLGYTFLDDTHFKHAGLSDAELSGYYLTEDQGSPLAVLPIDKRLRYTMPFEAPEVTIEYLHRLHRKGHDRLVVFADDGEKFGTWPGTHESVYAGGWLRRFCELLRANQGWLRTVLPSEAVATPRPAGRIYLPTASYAEMLHWALPSARAYKQYETFEHLLKEDGSYDQFGQFVRGGFWRNFLVKYPEANAMQKKMLRVSARLERLRERENADAGPDPRATRHEARATTDDPRATTDNPRGTRHEARGTTDEPRATTDNPRGTRHEARGTTDDSAREHLMAAQCNCPYWHGVFGGLYLANIRAAIYRELILAERELDRLEGVSTARVDVVDYDLDGYEEIIVETPVLGLYVSPARGGAIFEIDHKPSAYNYCDLVRRRREGYHEQLVDAAERKAAEALEPAGSHDHEQPAQEGQAKSIHDSFKVKEQGLERRLVYDAYRHGFLIDHFYGTDTSSATLRAGTATERGDFATGSYEHASGRDPAGRTRVHLRRQGMVDGAPVLVEKHVALDDTSSRVEIEYRVAALDGRPLTGTFGVEMSFSMSAGNEPDRYYEMNGKRLTDPEGRLGSEGEATVSHFALVDEWLGTRITVELAQPARLLRTPIETVSLSEDGFERNYQGSMLVALWNLGGATEWRMAIRQSIG